MIKAEVVFNDDYITLNGKDVWLHCESMHFSVGKHDEDHEDGGEIEEFFPSQEHAIRYCLEQNHESK